MPAKTARPNILIFCVDEMRADHLGCAGNPIIRTPNLDSIASRGTVFNRAYCNNPICMPSRATMFTGLLPRDHGVRVNGQALRKDLPTLPGVLSEAGYRTHSAGKLHLTPWMSKVRPFDIERFPEDIEAWHANAATHFPAPYYGFHSVDFVGGHTGGVCGPYLQWLGERGGNAAMLRPERALAPLTGALECYKMSLPPELHYNRFIADSTIGLIEDSSRGDQPFFAWCSFPDPHPPFGPPRPYCDLYDPADMPLPHRSAGEMDHLPSMYRKILSGEIRPNGYNAAGITDAHWREILAMTYGMVTHIDDEIGRVMASLKRCGLADNTIVIFTSDHGDMMGDHGLFMKAFYTFRGCIQVPLIAAGLHGKAGHQCDSLVSHIDLMPTVLDLCGINMPGANWRENPTPFERGSIQSLTNYPGQSWKNLFLGQDAPDRAPVVIENDDPTTGLRPRCLITASHRLTIYPGTEDGELFDLKSDPWELNNLWYDKAHQAMREGLIAELMAQYSLQTPLFPIPPWNA